MSAYKVYNTHLNSFFPTPSLGWKNPGLESSWLKILGLKSLGLKSPGLENSWLKSPGLKGLGLKHGVEKSGVEKSFNHSF